MPAILVNLLPPEIILRRQHNVKLLFINHLSIAVLIILVFFTSLTLTIRVAQKAEIEKTNQDVALAQEKVSAQSIKEGQVITLKSRLASINEISKNDSLRIKMLEMLINLIPPGAAISELSVDKKGLVNISLSSTSLDILETFISDLSNEEKNGGLAKQISMETMSLGKDARYYAVLHIVAKESL